MDGLFGPITAGMHNTLLLLAVVAMFVLAVLARYQRPECKECDHCKARSSKEEAEARERRHDYEHKGGGWGQNDPDRFSCGDESCRRNPRRD